MPKKKTKKTTLRASTSLHENTTNPTASRPSPGNSAAAELQKIASLLAQIWRRNKNQHGSQKWWKWLSLLKRRVRDLMKLEGDEGRRPSGGGTSPSSIPRVDAEAVREHFKKQRETEVHRSRLEAWMREVVVPRAWLAFSNLVAQRQFAVLGVVLLAIVARVGRVVGLPQVAVDHPARPGLVQKAETVLASSLRQTGMDMGEVVGRIYDSGETDIVGDGGKVVDRVGVTSKIILRNEVDIGQGEKKDGQEPKMAVTTTNNSKDSIEMVSSPTPEGDIMQRKKTRWKKSNAIDDLFGQLI